MGDHLMDTPCTDDGKPSIVRPVLTTESHPLLLRVSQLSGYLLSPFCQTRCTVR